MKYPTKSTSLIQTAGKICFAAAWAAIILAAFLNRDKLTVDGILQFTPKNLWLAALVILGLFALKSISMVLYSGILFMADGILFPLPIAILVNVLGAAIMLSIPYLIGNRMGASAVAYIKGKYPKAEKLSAYRSGNDFLFAFILRIIGVVPCDIASLYMGAVQVAYPKYLLGGLLGILPAMILYPIMGMGIKDIHAPQFWIALSIKVLLMCGAAAGRLLYRRKRK
mgnify:FL=1